MSLSTVAPANPQAVPITLWAVPPQPPLPLPPPPSTDDNSDQDGSGSAASAGLLNVTA